MQYNNPTQQFVEALCWIQSFLKKNAGRNFRISMKRHKTHETFDYGQAIAVFRWEHHGITVLYHLSGAKIQFMLFSVVLLIISCWVVGNTQKAIVTFQHHHMKQWIWSNQQEQASPVLKHFCSVDPLNYFSSKGNRSCLPHWNKRKPSPSANWAVHIYAEYAEYRPCSILHIGIRVCIFFCILLHIENGLCIFFDIYMQQYAK